ncbi:MAG: DUF1697 domain-containing protein [Winogradskyella sp.]|uniref:DUF1697 domain-containing protein n=1 Tax=Winogradskyella sp. TaxID=1883156 RepID=UPI00183D1388|nr:DUF1697 domain-containing protein [Winogradskyella sp.]MBT8244420.1 DUF1697 domain-containing protein [Winogradskyella sp.]NNK22522.1 DUF1697 domain-containing protein [Winogradskyella sp.]
MKTCIVLLRGINVGGHRKVPMAELRELFSKSGFKNVQTYIQSGNVVLQSSDDSKKIKTTVEKLIFHHFGFEVTTLVKTESELKMIFDACPFQDKEKEKSYFMMFENLPDKSSLEEVSKLSYTGEEIYITDDCIYFFSAIGYGRTKFNSNFFERKLKVNATARNYKTMLKLLAMVEET